jgi:hypothetical protein
MKIAVVAGAFMGTLIFDISGFERLEEIKLISKIDSIDNKTVPVDCVELSNKNDGILFIMEGNFGLRIFDIKNPREPKTLLKNFTFFGDSDDIKMNADETIAVIANGESGNYLI